MPQLWSLVIAQQGWEGREVELAELVEVYTALPKKELISALKTGRVTLKETAQRADLIELAQRLEPLGIATSIEQTGPQGEHAGRDLHTAEPAQRQQRSFSTTGSWSALSEIRRAEDEAYPQPTTAGDSTTDEPSADTPRALAARHQTPERREPERREPERREPERREPERREPLRQAPQAPEAAPVSGWGAFLKDAPAAPPELGVAGAAERSPAPSVGGEPGNVAPAGGEPPAARALSDERRRLSVGERLDQLAPALSGEPAPAAPPARRGATHRPVLSAAASIIAPGSGQALNGEPTRGLFFLLGAPLIVPWLWGAFDAARRSANLRDGRSLMPTRRSPVALAGFGAAAVLLWGSVAIALSPAASIPAPPENVADDESGGDDYAEELASAPDQEEAVDEAAAARPTQEQLQAERQEARRRQMAIHQLMVEARTACEEQNSFQCLQLARHILQIDPTQREARMLEAEAQLQISEQRGGPSVDEQLEADDPAANEDELGREPEHDEQGESGD